MAPRPLGGRDPRSLWPVTALAVSFAITASLWSAYEQGITADEPVHLRWSRRLMEMGLTERESNPAFNSKTPVTMANVAAREAGQYLLGVRDERDLLFCTRLPTVAAFALLLAAVFWLTRAWVGGRAAHLATMAAALDPNLIAHSSLATVDLDYALVHLLALAAAYRFARRPSLGRGAALGLALGLAFCTKFTAFLLVPGLLLSVVAVEERPIFGWKGLRTVLVGLLMALTVSASVVCAAYRFIRVGVPLSETRWESPVMQPLARFMPRLRPPLPADFLTGLDLSLADERNFRGSIWSVVILGRQHPHGVWYYFVLVWLMKTPVLLLASQVYGYLRVWRTGVLVSNAALRFLALNLLLALFYFSFVFRAQIGYRYVLMCVPLGYMIAAAGLESALAGSGAAIAVVVLVALLENLPYLGNHLAFTNAAVWPKTRVFRWITDSNVDWGGNRDKLAAYVAGTGLDTAHVDPVHILPGRNLLRFELASGTLRFQQHRWLRENLDPVGHFRHSFLLFDVDQVQFDRFLNEGRRLAPSRAAARLCSGAGSWTALSPREPMLFRARGSKDAAWIVCISTPEGADLILHATVGSILIEAVGTLTLERDHIRPGQMAWYRVEGGLHVLTAGLQGRFAGRWEVRKGTASVLVRPQTPRDIELLNEG